MELTDAIERIRPCVVQVGFSGAPTENVLGRLRNRGLDLRALHRVLGSGFLVNQNGDVVTAKHVVRGATEYAQRLEIDDWHLTVGSSLPNTQNMRGNVTGGRADVVIEAERHDIAIVRPQENPFLAQGSGIAIGGIQIVAERAVAMLQPERPRDGDPVAVSGYPLDSMVLLTNAGHIASAWTYDIQLAPIPGAPAGFPGRPEVEDTYVVDLQANPGNSGGPVYSTTDATVLGVCIAGRGSPTWWGDTGEPAEIHGRALMQSARLCVVVPTRYVIELIAQTGAPCEVF